MSLDILHIDILLYNTFESKNSWVNLQLLLIWLSNYQYRIICYYYKKRHPVLDKTIKKEFTKSRAMRAYVPKASQHFIFTCQRAKNVLFFKLACQRTNRRANFFNYFSKETMFQVWLTFANFKNTWAILENLSRETENLKHNSLTFACFSHAHHKSFWKAYIM